MRFESLTLLLALFVMCQARYEITAQIWHEVLVVWMSVGQNELFLRFTCAIPIVDFLSARRVGKMTVHARDLPQHVLARSLDTYTFI